jgi:NADPH:quinone reductase-like Zn-dependent oxidoreductase
MKAYWIKTDSGRTVFELRDTPPPPAPGPGQILVRVRAAGLNRGELIVGGVMHRKADKIGGTEAAGEIHAVGPDITEWKAGDRVTGRVLGADRGGFAEYTLMQAHQAMRIPPQLSFEQAAAIPVSFLAAYDAVVAYGKLQKGEWMLVTGASSAVGTCAVQLGILIGAKVIGTSGSAAKLERLKAIGMHDGIATRGPDFAETVRRMAGRGIDLAVNCVGGSLFAECMKTLGYHGRLATVGYVDGIYKAELDLQELHANRNLVFGVSNSRAGEAGHAATTAGFVRDILPAFNEGRIAPLVDRVFPLDELAAAKDYMESNAQVGKIVVRVA